MILKIIVKALKVYQDIYKQFRGEYCEEINRFINLLKPYEKLSIQEFELLLGKSNKLSSELKKKSQNIKDLGKAYYESKDNGFFTSDLEEFLLVNKDELFMQILDYDLIDSYKMLENIPLKDLKVNQLKFLGYALLDIELKGKNKSEQKKQLLQLLWKTIENQKMNGVYEKSL